MKGRVKIRGGEKAYRVSFGVKVVVCDIIVSLLHMGSQRWKLRAYRGINWPNWTWPSLANP